jgi:NADH-ubiquinone oxidoreductase chain 6
MNNLLLSLLAFATIFSSVLVITSKNPVVAVIFLISVFLCSAELLLELGVGFIGISYIILYVGAIIVLFLFVLMSINIKLTDILEAGSQYTKNIPLAISIGLLFSYELIKLFPFNIKNISILEIFVELLKGLNQLVLGTPTDSLSKLFTTFTTSIDTEILSFLQLETIGNTLYTENASTLIFCSVLLLLALSSPIIISKK